MNSLISRGHRWLLPLVGLACASGVAKADGKIQTVWTKNYSPVGAPAFSPDRSLVAIRTSMGVTVMRTVDGDVLYSNGVLNVRSVNYLSDGKTLVLGCGPDTLASTNRIVFIRTSDGVVTRTINGGLIGDPSIVSLSPNGLYIACAGVGNKLCLFRTSDGALLKNYPGSGSPVTAVAASSDGKYIASVTSANKVLLANITTGVLINLVNATHSGAVTTLQFSPSSLLLASGSADDTAKVWKTADGTVLPALTGHTGDVSGVAFSADSTRIATASADARIKIWNASTSALVRTITGTAPIYGTAFLADGNSVEAIDSQSVFRAAVSNGAFLTSAVVVNPSSGGFVVAPDGQNLASASDAGNVIIRSVASGSQTTRFTGLRNSSIAYTNDGASIAGLVNDTVNVNLSDLQYWNSATSAVRRTVRLDRLIDSFTLSPDNATIAAVPTNGDQSILYLYNTTSGALLRSISQASFRPLRVVYSPNSQTITALGFVTDASATNRIVTWKVSDGTVVNSFDIGTGLIGDMKLTPDGSTAVTAVESNIKLWKISDGTLVRTIPTTIDQLSSIALSPDGSVVAASGLSNSFQFLRISNGALLREYLDDRISGATLTFVPNGQRIVFSGLTNYGIAKAVSLTSTLLFQNKNTAAVHQWKVADHVIKSDSRLWNGGDTHWQVVGTPDLNGDGVPDLLFQYTGTGRVFAWILNANQNAIVATSDIYLNNKVLGGLNNWKVVGTPDLNRDGKDDILFQNTVTGAVYYWLTVLDGNKVTIVKDGFLWRGGSTSYRVIATPDLNGDGTPDILFQQTTSGNIVCWIMTPDGTAIQSVKWIYTTGLADWTAVTAGDFYGLGTVQALFQNKKSGVTFLWNLTDAVLGTYGTVSFSTSTSMELKGLTDLTGDGRPDGVLQDKTTGAVYYLGLNGMSVVSPALIYGSGIADWKLVSPR